MKKEASGKKGKVLWLVLGIVLLVAIVTGVILAFVLGGQEETTGGRPALYWNIDREANVDTSTGLSTRTPAEDGKYYIKFAYEGEQIELPVADKKLVNYIDGMELSHLVLDKSGVVVDVLPPQAVASVIGEALYVQKVEGDTIYANSSVTMNGRKITIKLNENVGVYNVSGRGEFVGEPLDPKELNPMDTIGVYGTFVPEDSEEEPVVTHVFVISKPVESPVYWRADKFYDTSNKCTTRIPDENGAYTIKWFVDGETVDLKCKDKDLVSSIDKADYHWCHWGLEFDEDGYIIATLNSGLASRTLLQCERFDITEIYDDGSYVATSLITDNGSFVQGVIGPECKIYDVSKVARAEGRVNTLTDGLKMGDRVCIWTDTTGKPVLIYLTNRMVDSDVYWNVTRSYSSATQQSTRKPNADGLYEIEMLRVGDNKNTIYYAKDIETATAVDSPSIRCVGLKLSEGNIIEYVYDEEALFGHTYLCSGYFLIDNVGSVCTLLSPAGSGFTRNAVLGLDCKIINVSTVGEYGAETTLRYGDSLAVFRAPNGEIAHIFVLKRLTGIESMAYRITKRAYDSEKKVTTREPDENGYYVYEFIHKGVLKTYKTKDKNIANLIDASSRAEMALELKGDIIVAVHDYSYPLGGITSSGYYITEINGDQIKLLRVTDGKTYEETLSDYCEIYNVSTSWLDHRGEIVTLKVGDYVSIFRDVNYEVGLIYVSGRRTNKMAFPVDRQLHPEGGTARTPDENGWYYIDLAVDGKISTYKTKNKNVIDAAESYSEAFGILVSGNEIIYTSTYGYVEDAYGKGVTDYTVTSVSGNKVNTIYTIGHATSTGSTRELTLRDNVKIYDVSDPSSPDFGKTTKLQVGDLIRSYTYLYDKELTQYIYVVSRCSREGGYKSYCEHCDKVVYWTGFHPNTSSPSYETHFYLGADVERFSQLSIYATDRTYEVVVDLNGHKWYRTDGGRVINVNNGSAVTVMDSAGGGILSNRNSTGFGGVASVGQGDLGKGILNLVGVTVTMDSDEGVTAFSRKGGLIYGAGIINVYDSEIKGGVVKSINSSGAMGGCIYLSSGVLNMYSGKISGGEARGQLPMVDENGNPVIDETTGKQKMNEYVGYGGNIATDGTAEINIYGGTIENGKAGRGGNVYQAGGTFTMTGGTVTGGVATRELGSSSSGRGGNFFVTGKSNVYIKGGVVKDGVAMDGSAMGGNFIGSSFDSTIHIMDSALVTNGAAKSGSNIALMYSHLNVTGGNITNEDTSVAGITATGTASGYSTVTVSGGNIEGELNLSGGVSDDPTAKYPDFRAIANISGGTIEFINATQVQKFAVSGKPVIKNVQLGAGVLLDVDAMVDGADITINTTGVFTKPATNAADYTGYFHAVKEGYLTGVSDNNELRFYHPDATLAYCEHCDAEAEWMAWDGETAMTGHYYLADNVQLSQQMDVAADFILDLKGYTVTAAENSRVFYVKAGGILNVVDSSDAKTGTITGGKTSGSDARGANLYVETNATFNLYSGTVTGGVNEGESSQGRGGNIFATGNVNLYGGTVSNGVALTGNGMGGNIMMTGGKLTVYENATISGGQAKNGLNVSLMYANLVNYGTISSNGATGNSVVASSMANRATSSFTMEGGNIDGTVYVYSGTPAEGVADYRAVVAINGGEIADLQIVDAYANAATFSGAPVVNKLTLGEGIILDVAQLTTGASIKLDSYVGVFTDVLTNANDIVAYFDATTVAYDVIVNADNKLEGVTTGTPVPDPEPEPDPEGEQCPHCNTSVTWTEWDGATVAAGHYYLTDNVQLTAELAVGEDFVLDLKGFSITAAEGKRTFSVSVNGVLSILDSSDEGTGKLVGSTISGAYGGNIYVNRGTFNLYSGTVTGGTISDNWYGGNIYVTGTGGTVNIYGGVVSNGSAARGGNICVSAATATISGDAQIIGGEAVGTGSYGRGGNIYITGVTSKLTVSDNAMIADGVAGSSAGNIFCMYGNMEFKDNVQVKNGTDATGKVNMNIGGTTNPSTVTISGGTYTDGVIIITGTGTGAATATISGGTFKDEVSVGVETKLNVSGAPVFENLKLAENVLINVDALTDGASIKVNATSNVITDTLTNANDMVGYFDTVAVDRKVVVDGDNKLAIAEACACGCKALASEVQWEDLNAFIKNEGGDPNKKMSGNVHYRLSADLNVVEIFGEGTQLQVVADSNIVIDLNGFTLYNENRMYVAANGVLTIVDTSAEGTGVLSTKGDDSVGTAGRAFYLKGILNLRSGTIALADDAFVSHQALINLGDANAVFNMYGGAVVGGKAETNMGDTTANLGIGGNIYARLGTVNIYGGTVSGGTATSLTVGETTYEGLGGNIYVTNLGTLNIYGGTVTGGTAAKGADVYLTTNTTAGGTMNISGGVVAGEVYVPSDKATVAVSGSAILGNLNLQNGALVTVGDLATGAQIAVSATGDFTDVLENAESYLAYFTSVSEDKLIEVTVDSKLTMVSNNACPCGCGAEKDQITWVDPAAYFDPETTATMPKVTENVHFRLENDFSVEEFFGESHQLMIGASDSEGANVTIDLNGHTWSSDTRMYVYKLSTLTILDTSAEKTGVMTGKGTTNNGRVIISKGTLNLRSGTLTMTKEGAADCNYAGIVYVSEGVFNMYGGAILDGEALTGSSEGGNVYAWKGTFNMYGGTISGGAATNGANVFIHKAGSMNFVGGTIEDYDNTVLINE